MDKNIQKYRAFLTAAEYGNITKAAKAMSYSQSSVSKMIADLENEMELTLLERSKTGVALTDAGRELLPYTKSLLDTCVMLEDKVSYIKNAGGSVIRIGVFSSIAEAVMPDILTRFHRKYPEIKCEILTGDHEEIERGINEGKIHCGFIRSGGENNDLDTLCLVRDSFVAVLPKGHPLCEKETIEPHDLDGRPFIVFEIGERHYVTEFLERYDVRPEIISTTGDCHFIMAMAEEGLCCGMLSEMVVRHSRTRYDVEVRPLAGDVKGQIGFVVKNRSDISDSLGKLVRYVMDYAGV